MALKDKGFMWNVMDSVVFKLIYDHEICQLQQIWVVKYMYSAQGHMVDSNDFICSTYADTSSVSACEKWVIYGTYVVGIFVSG